MQDLEQQLNLSRKAEADYASAAAAAREVEQKLERRLGEAEPEVHKSQHALASSEAAAAEAERALRDRLAVVEAELVLAREDVSALSGKLASSQEEYHGLAAKNADISLAVGRCLACFRVALMRLTFWAVLRALVWFWGAVAYVSPLAYAEVRDLTDKFERCKDTSQALDSVKVFQSKVELYVWQGCVSERG